MSGIYKDVPDEELARQVRGGDEGAFEELILRHEASVRRWIYWIDRRADRVEDLAQESFLKAWRGRKGFEGRSSWRTWIMRIALRVCLDAKRRIEPPSEPLSEQTVPDGLLLHDIPSAERVVLARSGILQLQRLLDRLPPEARAVIVLRYVEGYNAAEIGKMMGRPHGTIRRLIFEARNSLRAMMEENRESLELSGGEL